MLGIVGFIAALIWLLLAWALHAGFDMPWPLALALSALITIVAGGIAFLCLIARDFDPS